jgi:hypothetical protein
MAKPLLMTCAEPPSPTSVETIENKTSVDMTRVEKWAAAIEQRIDIRMSKMEAMLTHLSTRARTLEDQIGKIPPLLDRIAAMEKTLAKLPSLNPSIIKGLREHIDWTKVVSSDEDLLEDEYRGWPAEKKRTIF